MSSPQPTPLEVLATSQLRLHRVVGFLDDDTIVGSAYPSRWTIAEVMSHLGSGAVITARRLRAELDGESVPDGFAESVWDEWNAKSPRAQVDDALAADADLVTAFESVSALDRAGFEFAMGPMAGDFGAFVNLRLNEHALHTWDVEVSVDPHATIPPDSTALVVDNLALIARFTAQTTPGEATRVHVDTTGPDRRFAIDFTPDGTTLTPTSDATAQPGLTLTADAFIRLVYGRLDPDHTPPFTGGPALVDRLRATYPGA